MEKFTEISTTTPQGVNSKDVIDYDSELFALPKKRMLSINEDCDNLTQLLNRSKRLGR